ncbi:MAG: hydroxyacid dehydrogenase [Clostridia bacterium]|nr:hydroxyacid dehydrogenase [Clostridia bacterium]
MINTPDKLPLISVLDAATLGSDLDLSPLDGVGNVTVYQNTSPDEIPARIADAEICLINKVKLGEPVLKDAKNLKLICIFATGYDNIDVAYCRSRGIAVCNVVGYSTDSVAQLTAGMALYLAGHMYEYTEAVRSGRYSAGSTANILTPVYHELAGKTWGIAGYGNIGKKVGAVASALSCRIIAHKRTPDSSVECVDMDTLCRESDIISAHFPLNDATRGIFSAERIAMMKPGAIFINVARGAVADEAALAAAVSSGRLGGLGIDVYSREPFTEDHPFYAIKSLPNVCLTPHMAWGSAEARKRCLDEIILNIGAFYRGEKRCRVD